MWRIECLGRRKSRLVELWLLTADTGGGHRWRGWETSHQLTTGSQASNLPETQHSLTQRLRHFTLLWLTLVRPGLYWVTVWRCDSVTEWWEYEVVRLIWYERTCPRSPQSLGRTQREVPTRGLNNIRHVLLSQPTLNILNLHYLLLRPGRQAGRQAESRENFRIFSSQSASRPFHSTEVESIWGLCRVCGVCR